jgi:hypothetical protein
VVSPQRRDRRQACLAQEIEGAGKKNCNAARAPQRLDPLLARILEMIGGQRLIFGGERRTAEV